LEEDKTNVHTQITPGEGSKVNLDKEVTKEAIREGQGS